MGSAIAATTPQERDLLAILETVAEFTKGELTTMDMVPVSSSIIRAIGYDVSSQILRVELDTKRTYEYYNVPFATYSRFLAADSQGAFFNLEIKGKFNVKEVFSSTVSSTSASRKKFHDLLDRAFNETPIGKSFLPKYVELVLEDSGSFS